MNGDQPGCEASACGLRSAVYYLCFCSGRRSLNDLTDIKSEALLVRAHNHKAPEVNIGALKEHHSSEEH